MGTLTILDDAYNWAKENGYNGIKYDANKDGWVDAICLIYSCPHTNSDMGQSSDPYWAFTFWDYNNISKTPNPLSPLPNTYMWASYDFINDGKEVNIDIDAHTYIHEYGHVMGLDDYYDYDREHAPMGAIDMQDYNIGDHNAFSKYAWGWIDPIVIKDECEIEISPTSSSGDVIILSSNWEGSAFDEYLIMDFVDNKNLWAQDSKYAYIANVKTFKTPGIRIMHADARLARHDIKNGEIVELTNKMTTNNRYSIAFSNTPSRSYSEGAINNKTGIRIYDDLLQIISQNHNYKTTYDYKTVVNDNSLFKEGDTFSIPEYKQFFINDKLHNGSTIPFRMIVKSLNSEKAVLKFERI